MSLFSTSPGHYTGSIDRAPVPPRRIASPSPLGGTANRTNSVGMSVDRSATPGSISSTFAEVIRALNPSTDRMDQVVQKFIDEMSRGLRHDAQTVRMLPSFVTNVPTGQEKGDYLALDLGGTNFRVCLVRLQGEGKVSMKHAKFVVSEQNKKDSGAKLFKFLASCVASFLAEVNIDSEKAQHMKLGFTFSFPVAQKAIDHGQLLLWNKGFECDGVLGKDVVAMLREALKEEGVPVPVTAVVNDTVGTLISHAYVNPKTTIGVILGTGTNAAYVEDMSRMTKWKGDPVKSGKQVINTEWGAFDNEKKVLPLTKWDNQLDAAYVPGLQVYEKMISGRYLGEIMRYILIDLINQGALFNGVVPEEMRKEYEGFLTAYMSRIEADDSENLDDVADLFTVQFGLHNTTLEERQSIKTMVHHLANRAARLVAAGIAAIFIMTERMGGVVAVDGSMFEHYPNFPSMMQDGLRELLGGTLANRISLGKDGSGIGAGLISMLATMS